MSESSSPPRRPRLSLQIKALSTGPSIRTSRTLAAAVDPASPTSFNTLSNVYVTAIDRSTPVQPDPVTAVNSKPPTLSITTQDDGKDLRPKSPYLGPYLDTPLTAHPLSPAIAREVNYPSTMTATPPLSAGPVDPNSRVFTFSPKDTVAPRFNMAVPSSPRTPQRRTTLPASMVKLPYTHQRSLHSILRNSPLPPLSTKSPSSPSRRSLRLQEKAAKKVAYNSPLEQTITTNKYVKSHIDLLSEDASPFSPCNVGDDPEIVLDQTMAYTGNETRDGGQTPGPFEEMRRRMAGLGTSAPLSPVAAGVRKRKKKEKKRRWVWTIGQDEDDEDAGSSTVTGKPVEPPPKPAVPVIAVPAPRGRGRQNTARAPKLVVPAAPPAIVVVEHTPPPAGDSLLPIEPPTPSVDSTMSQDSVFEASADVEMSDVSSLMSDADDKSTTLATMDMDMDLDVNTPIAASGGLLRSKRLDSVDSAPLGPGIISREAPIPSDLIAP